MTLVNKRTNLLRFSVQASMLARKMYHRSLAFKKLLNLPKGTDLIILSAALFGVTMVLTKGSLNDIPPLTLLSIQSASSVTLFWTIILVQKISVPLNKDTLKIALTGLLEPGLSYIFGIFGLALTTACNSSLINTTEPLVTIALSWLILGESISISLVALGFIACLGVIFVALPDLASFGDGSMLGNCLIFVSVLFAGLYSVITSVKVKTLPPVVLAAIQQSISLILFLVMTFGAFALHLETIDLTTTTFRSVLIAMVSGAFGYGLAFLLYLGAINYQSATRISLYLTLIPIFGIISAYFLLGERFMPVQIFGASLILVTIAGISQLPAPKSQKS